MKYRKKPVVIEARQVNYGNRYEIAQWCGGSAADAGPSGTIYAPGLLKIATLEGEMWATERDYVICGVQGGADLRVHQDRR